MAIRIFELSQRKAARVAGVLYLMVWLFVLIAAVFFYANISVPGEAIAPDLASFRIGFVSDLIHHTCFLLLSWALYVLFKEVNKNLALIFVLCVLVSVAIQCINTLNIFTAVKMLSNPNHSELFDADQLHALSLFYLDLHQNGVHTAQMFFGLWLLPLGYLVYKSGYVSRILGILLMIGCFGYLIDVFQYFLLPGYEVITYPGLAVATISEFSLMGWLLWKGAKIQSSNEFE
jgi:hypothetical protein